MSFGGTLLARLLAVNPGDRPTGAEVLNALGDVHQAPLAPSARDVEDFVGRAVELSQLQQGFDACLTGIQTTVVVSGEAGIGKSELVRRFSAVIADRAVVLPGRFGSRS